MKTTTLKQTLENHNNKVKYYKTNISIFIGGIVTGIMAWELGGLLTDMIIQIIS
jgi:hypothetical protein